MLCCPSIKDHVWIGQATYQDSLNEYEKNKETKSNEETIIGVYKGGSQRGLTKGIFVLEGKLLFWEIKARLYCNNWLVSQLLPLDGKLYCGDREQENYGYFSLPTAQSRTLAITRHSVNFQGMNQTASREGPLSGERSLVVNNHKEKDLLSLQKLVSLWLRNESIGALTPSQPRTQSVKGPEGLGCNTGEGGFEVTHPKETLLKRELVKTLQGNQLIMPQEFILRSHCSKKKICFYVDKIYIIYLTKNASFIK